MKTIILFKGTVKEMQKWFKTLPNKTVHEYMNMVTITECSICGKREVWEKEPKKTCQGCGGDLEVIKNDI